MPGQPLETHGFIKAGVTKMPGHPLENTLLYKGRDNTNAQGNTGNTSIYKGRGDKECQGNYWKTRWFIKEGVTKTPGPPVRRHSSGEKRQLPVFLCGHRRHPVFFCFCFSLLGNPFGPRCAGTRPQKNCITPVGF